MRRRRARKKPQSAADRMVREFEKKTLTIHTAEDARDGRGSVRRGKKYEAFVAAGWPEAIIRGTFKQTEVAELLGESSANISRWLQAYAIDKADVHQREGWTRDPAVDEALTDFVKFSARYFADNPDLCEQPAHHVRWAEEINTTLDEGGRLLLLAPQRHGKTSMLIKYVMWRLMRDPNMCIGWVGKSENVASESTGLIQQFLTDMTEMVEEVFGPGTDLSPPSRSGLSWTPSKLTLSTRTRARKSPSLVALGIDSNILGRDMDLIVVDDPVERGGNKGMVNILNRDKAYERLVTDINSRKMRRTGFAYITSRMHVDDPPGRIILSHQRDWRVVVDRAHDPSCAVAEEDHPDNAECLLWPDAPNMGFKWLMEQKRQSPEHFERNYQNNPSGDTFDRPTMEDMQRAFAPRSVGEKSPGLRMLCSVDPGSGVKKHAFCVWAYSNSGEREIVDIFTPPAGSPGFVKGLQEVYDKYRVLHFVVEKNRFEDQLRNDLGVKELRNSLGLNIQTHYTGGHNKQAANEGVTAMMAEFRKQEPGITLPGANPEDRRLMQPFIREILNFDPELAAQSKHRQDDRVMAAWVGWYWIGRHQSSEKKTITPNYPSGFRPSDGQFGLGWNLPNWSAA